MQRSIHAYYFKACVNYFFCTLPTDIPSKNMCFISPETRFWFLKYSIFIIFQHSCSKFSDLKRKLTLKPQPHKMIKHTQRIFRQQSTNCLSVFDHFGGLGLKGLKMK